MRIFTFICIALASAGACAQAQWSEWREIGSLMLPQDEPDAGWTGFFSTSKRDFERAGVPFPDFSKPVTVMERTSSSDGLTQLRLDNMFKDRSIILDVDANGFITCEPQETNIVNAWKTSESQPDYLLFQIKDEIADGSYYYPISGQMSWGGARLYSDYGYHIASDHRRKLQISGHTPLLFEPEDDMYLPSTATEASVKVTKAPEVDFYRVIPKRQNEGWTTNIEQIYKHTVPAGEPYAYTDHRDENFTIPLWDARTDHYIIPFSSDGRAAGDAIFHRINKNHIPDGDWRPIGKGRLTESVCYFFSDKYYYELDLPSIESEVDVEVSDSPRPMIRIKNPFGESHPLYHDFNKYPDIALPDEDYYLTFDISNPNRVTIPISMWAANPRTMGCTVSESLAIGASESDLANWTFITWGTYDGNRITMHKSSLNLPRQGADSNTIILDIPSGGENGADIASADFTDTPAEYYNLQGMRVSAPSGGIFIRRQGATVTRILIP